MGLPWQLIKASSFCCPIFWLRKQLRQEKAISQVAALIAYTANYNIGKYIFSLLGGYKVQVSFKYIILFNLDTTSLLSVAAKYRKYLPLTSVPQLYSSFGHTKSKQTFAFLLHHNLIPHPVLL